MNIVNPLAEKYTEQFTTEHTALLQQIINETYATHAQPHMLSGHVQGKFLQMISLMLQPLKVLEIGTFTGFSALCLATGLQANGKLHTIELREKDALLSQNNFNKSAYANKIKLHVGNAKEIIPTLNDVWDLIFIDADKTNYIDYYELTLPTLKTGGFILTDNVLFHGQVLEENITGKNAIAIHAFNEHVKNDERTEQVMLSVRDGISIIRKK
ncbi:MAG: O-methyltransferase [Ferruginibacter sp.]